MNTQQNVVHKGLIFFLLKISVFHVELLHFSCELRLMSYTPTPQKVTRHL